MLLHLVGKVENELQKLIDDNQIIRLEKRHDDLIISPVVIRVKKASQEAMKYHGGLVKSTSNTHIAKYRWMRVLLNIAT